MNDAPVVYVVDDDDAVRNAMKLLLDSVGLACETFSSAAEFLAAYDPARHCCLVSDIRMPGMSGLELQQELSRQHMDIPLIFITGHGDVPMAVSAIQSGATDFIQKPFRDHHLIGTIQHALERDGRQRVSRVEANVVRERMNRLTPRDGSS
jgi:FixJ family two-component response regulator